MSTMSNAKTLASLLITAIANNPSWSRAWMRAPAINCASKKPFRGANRLILTLTAAHRGWSGSRWGTEAQWNKKGFNVPKGTMPTRILSMVEAKPEDTICMMYGAKRITLVRPHDEFAAIQVGDDDSWTATPPNVSGLLTVINGAFPGIHIMVPDMSHIKASEDVTAEERYCSHLVRAALRLVIESKMLFGLPQDMTDPEIVNLAAEIGTAFVLNDFGMMPERLRDHATVRRWSTLLSANPEIATFASGLAQHAIDRIREAGLAMQQDAVAKAA